MLNSDEYYKLIVISNEIQNDTIQNLQNESYYDFHFHFHFINNNRYDNE